MSSYQRLIRLLKEQCVEEADPTTCAPKVSVKANGDLPSDSPQNSSDPQKINPSPLSLAV